MEKTNDAVILKLENYLLESGYYCEETTDILTDLGKGTIYKCYDVRFTNDIEMMIDIYVLHDGSFEITKEAIPFECYSDEEREELQKLIKKTDFSIDTNFTHNHEENKISVSKKSESLDECIADIETFKSIIKDFIDTYGVEKERNKRNPKSRELSIDVIKYRIEHELEQISNDSDYSLEDSVKFLKKLLDYYDTQSPLIEEICKERNQYFSKLYKHNLIYRAGEKQ